MGTRGDVKGNDFLQEGKVVVTCRVGAPGFEAGSRGWRWRKIRCWMRRVVPEAVYEGVWREEAPGRNVSYGG